jgi:hypothetical protein
MVVPNHHESICLIHSHHFVNINHLTLFHHIYPNHEYIFWRYYLGKVFVYNLAPLSQLCALLVIYLHRVLSLAYQYQEYVMKSNRNIAKQNDNLHGISVVYFFDSCVFEFILKRNFRHHFWVDHFKTFKFVHLLVCIVYIIIHVGFIILEPI